MDQILKEKQFIEIITKRISVCLFHRIQYTATCSLPQFLSLPFHVHRCIKLNASSCYSLHNCIQSIDDCKRLLKDKKLFEVINYNNFLSNRHDILKIAQYAGMTVFLITTPWLKHFKFNEDILFSMSIKNLMKIVVEIFRKPISKREWEKYCSLLQIHFFPKIWQEKFHSLLPSRSTLISLHTNPDDIHSKIDLKEIMYYIEIPENGKLESDHYASDMSLYFLDESNPKIKFHHLSYTSPTTSFKFWYKPIDENYHILWNGKKTWYRGIYWFDVLETNNIKIGDPKTWITKLLSDPFIAPKATLEIQNWLLSFF